jgi:hypothetical protein
MERRGKRTMERELERKMQEERKGFFDREVM